MDDTVIAGATTEEVSYDRLVATDDQRAGPESLEGETRDAAPINPNYTKLHRRNFVDKKTSIGSNIIIRREVR